MPPRKQEKQKQGHQCVACNLSLATKEQLDRHQKSIGHQQQAVAFEEHIIKAKEKQQKISWVRKHQPVVTSCIQQFHLDMASCISLPNPVKLDPPVPQNLSDSIKLHYQYSRPSTKMVSMRQCMIKLVGDIASSIFETGAQVKIYGSIVCVCYERKCELECK